MTTNKVAPAVTENKPNLKMMVALPPYEVLNVEGDGQCGFRALRLSAKFVGLAEDVEALEELGWSNIPRKRQWTDDTSITKK